MATKQPGAASTDGSLYVILTDGLGNVVDPTDTVVSRGENHMGYVSGNGSLVPYTLTLDTSGAYADGEVLSDTMRVKNCVRIPGGRCILHSLMVLDEDDQGAAFDLIFLDANYTIGTPNSAVSVSDINARSIIGRVSVGSGDYYDMGGCRIACLTALNLIMKAVPGDRDLYLATVSRGTGTYTAQGIKLRLGFLWD